MGCFAALIGGPAAAQIASSADSILPEIAVRGRGWAQLLEQEELLEFGLALIEASLMTAALAYHPVIVATRRSRADFEAPRALFIYALIGMVVGFLIMHHGYLIGFVLFGLGGLLRFRTDTSTSDTTRMILITLIGLCVGLDLPVVAFITTASAWVIVYAFGGPVNYGLEVRFSTKKSTTSDAMLALRDRLKERGYQTVSMSKTKYKPIVQYVVSADRGLRRSGLEREMAALAEAKENAISDWHVD